MIDQPFDWTEATGRWRRIGLEFREECRAICCGNLPVPPRKRAIPEGWGALREARIARHMTQQQLADAVSCHVNTIKGAESGKHPPSPKMRARIEAFIAG
jgi:DNA-binding XRE family transcriptional regulator